VNVIKRSVTIHAIVEPTTTAMPRIKTISETSLFFIGSVFPKIIEDMSDHVLINLDVFAVSMCSVADAGAPHARWILLDCDLVNDFSLCRAWHEKAAQDHNIMQRRVVCMKVFTQKIVLGEVE
jgi:hypothetical protein